MERSEYLSGPRGSFTVVQSAIHPHMHDIVWNDWQQAMLPACAQEPGREPDASHLCLPFLQLPQHDQETLFRQLLAHRRLMARRHLGYFATMLGNLLAYQVRLAY